MVSTFSPPIKAVAVRDSLPRIIIAIAAIDSEVSDHVLVAVNGDGVMEYMLITDVIVDWRYDAVTELWQDVNEGSAVKAFGDSE